MSLQPGFVDLHRVHPFPDSLIKEWPSWPSLRASRPHSFIIFLEGGLGWSPIARVQRGSSETARCTSTGDHLVCPLTLLLRARVPGAQDQCGCSSHLFFVRVLRARRAPGRSPSPARVPLHYFIFKGSLVDPRLRASNEHIPIVRVPRAGGRPGYPIPFPSSPARQSNAQTLSSRRRLGPSRNIRSAHGSHAQGGSAPETGSAPSRLSAS